MMKSRLPVYWFLEGVTFLLMAAGSRAAPVSWFPGPPLPQPTSWAATVVAPSFGNVLAGGTSYYPDVSYPVYLIATNAYWSGFGAVSGVSIGGGVALIDGNIMIFGGTDGTGSQSSVALFNLTQDTPPVYAPMTTARSYFGYSTDRSSRAYALGGLDTNGAPLASAERFDLGIGANGAWSAIASLPAARFQFPAVFDHTNQIYIFGGYTNSAGPEVGSSLRYSVSRNTWTNLAPMPIPVAGSAATFGVDGKIYVVGGVSAGLTVNSVQVYDPVADSWTLSTPLPEGLSGSAMGVDSLGRLLVMGGSDTNGVDVADVWRSQPLSEPDSAPAITQLPSTNATYLAPYQSSIAAIGNPPPTYELLSGPAGMNVDFYTGAITWTPSGIDQIGSFGVTISATNYAGATNWSFVINVPNPPPTPVTNLTVVGVTETSVSLSWSPEPPEAGAVTFSVWLKHVLHDPKGSGSTVWYSQIGGDTTETHITISGLAAGLSQGYYVKATGPGGISGYTAVSASTLPAPTPANFRIAGLTSTTISLAWDAPVGGLPVMSYDVLGWFDGIAAQYPLSYGSILSTSVTLTNLAPGNAMLWGVSAKDNAGNASAYVYLPGLVVNSIPSAPRLSTVGPGADGEFQFDITQDNASLQTIWIQATTNPAVPDAWVQLSSAFPTNNPFRFTDTNAVKFPTRFYRAVIP